MEGAAIIHFVGAGSGAADLITVRGARLIAEADVIIYAGSLVNPQLLDGAREGCALYDSSRMTLEEVLGRMLVAEEEDKSVVRLHTGDPCLYGTIREQMDLLDAQGIAYDYTPGVSSLCGAAAALNAEYTLPNVSQSVIVTRMEGRTAVPSGEKMSALASHGCSMVIFLSVGLLEPLTSELLAGGVYTENTPAALVYKATWPDEKVLRCTVGTLARVAAENDITRTALVLVGDFLDCDYERSKLYDPMFETGFRAAKQDAEGGADG